MLTTIEIPIIAFFSLIVVISFGYVLGSFVEKKVEINLDNTQINNSPFPAAVLDNAWSYHNEKIEESLKKFLDSVDFPKSISINLYKKGMFYHQIADKKEELLSINFHSNQTSLSSIIEEQLKFGNIAIDEEFSYVPMELDNVYYGFIKVQTIEQDIISSLFESIQIHLEEFLIQLKYFESIFEKDLGIYNSSYFYTKIKNYKPDSLNDHLVILKIDTLCENKLVLRHVFQNINNLLVKKIDFYLLSNKNLAFTLCETDWNYLVIHLKKIMEMLTENYHDLVIWIGGAVYKENSEEWLNSALVNLEKSIKDGPNRFTIQ